MKKQFSYSCYIRRKRSVLFVSLFLILCGYASLYAQLTQLPCQSQAQYQLHVNNIDAVVNLGSRLFSPDHFNPAAGPDVTGPSTIYSTGLWLGSLGPDGQYKLYASDYRHHSQAGPLGSDNTADSITCLNWDQMFTMQGSMVAQFLNDLPGLGTNISLAIQQYPKIMGWPGRNNPYFLQIKGFDLPADKTLAPFFDENSDGVYDPLQGDYPVVALDNGVQFLPTEWVWNISNTGPLTSLDSNSTYVGVLAEIQSTAWAFHCEDQTVLNRTVFTSQQVTYLGQEPLDSFYMALWCDFDLGCSLDDYTGCTPDRNAFFAYNRDASDGEPSVDCAPVFANTPPVQMVVLLNKSLDKFITYNRGGPSGQGTYSYNSDPNSSSDFYNYISGSWLDGSPITFGDNGYHENGGTPTNFAFPGDPSDPNGWSMVSANIPFADRRALGSHYVGKLLPGQVETITAAWTANFDGTFPNILGPSYTDMATLQTIYDQGFSNACAVSGIVQAPADAVWNIAPNPAKDFITVRYNDLTVQEIRLFDATGRLAGQWSNVPDESMTISTGHLPEGIYLVQIRTKSGYLTRKVVLGL
ncbi:MAG TPA: T9SS type A sorting domain-containing protein [Saprospiraceae bacterium]|nr:T9SS type A sorting domain-containing protein [Saprospiraceae bacterium]HPI08493.1 T9SS type A sorting domain-containing protein [Saprospiraceae bacterium]